MKNAGENVTNAWTLHLLQQTARYFAHHHSQQPAYLVGGSLRSLLLNEPCIDWDIATVGNVPQIARHLADSLGGHYAHMNDKASRVVVKRTGHETIIDISPITGGSIEADLRLRDFTLNAIAAPLAAIVDYLGTPGAGPMPLIDPLRGAADIEARRIRAVGSEVFRHDPLRMLRAVRLALRYHLTIDPPTAHLIRHDASLLPTVAAERIHEELYAILAPAGATAQLRILDSLHLFTALMPEFIPARALLQPRPHHWDVLEHSFETVGALEQLVIALQQDFEAAQLSLLRQSAGDLAEIRALLLEAEQQAIFHIADLSTPAMKLAALLHDIGKPATCTIDEEGSIHFYGHQQAGAPPAAEIMKRLSASTHDRRVVQLITIHHMRPGQLAQETVVTPRAVRRYFVDLGPTGIHIALFSLADHLATYGPAHDTRPPNAWERHLALVRLLLTRYIRERDHILPPRLISAGELMRRLQLAPGPIIGRLLEQIAEAQAEGLIHSKEEALWLAQEQLQQEE